MTARKVAPQIIEPVPVSFAPSEFGDDAQRKWVAANAGEMFAEQVGGSIVVAGCRCSDHLDVVTFPAHLAAVDGSPAYNTTAVAAPVSSASRRVI